MASKDRSERHVVVSCLFKKSSFKTAGIQAMLESAVEAVSEDTSTLEWVNNIRILHKRKELYGPNEADMVPPTNQFPKFELLVFPMSFDYKVGAHPIRSNVDDAIAFIMEVLRSDVAIPFYQEYLTDQHDRLWERLITNAETNKSTVADYTKHFIANFAKNEPSILFNVSLDHFLLDDDIKRIVNDMGYYTANDMTSSKLSGKALYRDATATDVPSWMTNATSAAMPHNIVH
jgi:hypothetical protein